jgi:tetratricopeptide (TPR) repeat protein
MMTRSAAAFTALLLCTSAAPAPAPANLALAAALAANMCGQGAIGTGEGTGASTTRGAIVLVPGLTPAHMPVSDVKMAQAYFDQGLGQLWGFDYDEALESFREARRRDPDCAMCNWGEALALGPYINSGPIEAATIAEARALTARALGSNRLSERDRALMDAVHARHAPGGGKDGVHGDLYADTMIALAQRWPDDDLVAILAAEAIMTSQPWDYWEAGGKVPKARAGTALALVDKILARDPNHPQAIHLLIHLTEASANPAKAAGPAARLGGLAPGAPHMVHMPSHTWYRVGRFADAIAANKQAIAADEAYARAVGADPQYYGYFNHHTHFLASSAVQIGDRATALAAAAQLEAAIGAADVARSPWLEMRLVTALHTRTHFLSPAQTLALPRPDQRLRRLSIAWHGVRAEALALSGNPQAAEGELLALRQARDALERPENSGRRSRRGGGTMEFAAIADAVARGRIATARGDTAAALRAYAAAEAIEANLPYQEPPLWPMPISVLSGQLRLAQGDAAAAAVDFRRALAQRPGNHLASDGLIAAGTG